MKSELCVSPPDLLAAAEKEFSEVRRLRRELHENPELGFELHKTSDRVAQALSSLDLKVRRGVAKTGIVADLVVDPSLPTVALRADMDALPIQEMANVPFASQVPGRAHLCGHDAHTAMLVGAARVILKFKHKLQQNVRFLFQPNEENFPGGAPSMIEDGALDGVSSVYGIHVWPSNHTGELGIVSGPAMAQPDTFQIELRGQGGHAAVPHWAKDPIVAACHLVQSLQTVVSRSVDPMESAVLSVTQFHSGTTHNVIPETVQLEGTVRTFSSDVQKRILVRIEELIKGVELGFGVKCSLKYQTGYPALINPDAQARRVWAIGEQMLGSSKVVSAPAVMGGEDFSYYLQQVPGCFYFLGIRNEALGSVYMCHDPRFLLDEAAMPLGVAMHAAIALSVP